MKIEFTGPGGSRFIESGQEMKPKEPQEVEDGLAERLLKDHPNSFKKVVATSRRKRKEEKE
jgi:hypothetical protein